MHEAGSKDPQPYTPPWHPVYTTVRWSWAHCGTTGRTWGSSCGSAVRGPPPLSWTPWGCQAWSTTAAAATEGLIQFQSGPCTPVSVRIALFNSPSVTQSLQDHVSLNRRSLARPCIPPPCIHARPCIPPLCLGASFCFLPLFFRAWSCFQ